ncbi:MAG: dihydroorotate dehydrogenase 2 [Chloroflexi bacterium]|nr:dihydroorotate dehydrogenase 2 [Chloroflexota bacterium]
MAFAIPPEASHRLAELSLRAGFAWAGLSRFMAHRDERLETAICGVHVPNPVGMSAGFDKNCRVLGSLLNLGFGFAVGGTVTLNPRAGNARPRLFRNIRDRALVNALGFPGVGLDAAERRLRRLGSRHRGRVFASVAGTEDGEILECHARLEPYVAGIEVNISSPNTAGLRVYQEPERLSALVRSIALQKRKPLLIKLPRFAEAGGEARVAALARAAVTSGAEGLVVANTLPVEDRRLAVGRGGLSGAPLFDSTLRLVSAVREAAPSQVTVVACGGVFTADDVRRLQSAGASAVQLYTAFVYEGPGLPGRLARDLSRALPGVP